jgi:hypothetical protein
MIQGIQYLFIDEILLVFGWSMQFIVIELEAARKRTKTPTTLSR